MSKAQGSTIIFPSTQTHIVHPVTRGDYTSYYPKSIIKARISDDILDRRFNYSRGAATFNHDVDMEALTFGPDAGASYLYVGDEVSQYSRKRGGCENWIDHCH